MPKPNKEESWHPVTNTTKIPLSSKKAHNQEAYLVTLAPGVDIHDLDGCQIKLHDCSERVKLVEKQSNSSYKFYKYEDPMTDTCLEDPSRVKKLKGTGGTDKLLGRFF